MSDFTVTITPPETTSITIGGGISPHNSTHAPNGSDSLESWYATTGSLAYVSGQISIPAGTVLLTGDQNVSGVKNFSSRPTVNGSGVMLTGENGGTGYLADYVQKTETGAFVSSNQTGQLTGAFYPLSSNPSAYLQGAVVRPSNTGNFVDTVSAQTINNLKTFNSGIIVGQNSVNGTGSSALGGSGNHVTGRNSVVVAGINNRVNAANSFIGGGHNNRVETSGSAVVGGWANMIPATAGVHNFIGGGVGNRVDNGNYNAILGGINNSIFEGQDKNAILGGEANALLNTSNCFTLGSYNTLFGTSSTIENSFAFGYNASVSHSNAAVINEGLAMTESSGERTIVIQFDSGIHLKGPTFFSSRPTLNGTGFLLSGEASTPSTGYLTGFVNKNETGIFASTGSLSSLSGHLQGQVNTLNSQTGNYVTGLVVRLSETGQFYAASNPSGFITGVDLSSYSTTSFTTGISGHLQTQISAISASSGAFLTTGAGNNLYISLTGDQDISGSKDFQTRPTVLDVPVLVSGDAVELIHLYGKNDEGMTVYKAQPVYIEGANGTNPLLKLASNTGERTSSKTIGLLAQNLLINEIGSVITEGILEGFDTSAASAGDPMWLGTSGNILYGTGNKPFGNNHQVYLGSVLRSNNINGKVYVKVQNGYEIDELHNVYAQNASDKDSLLYDSASGSWISRIISTGDVSGITSLVFKSETGNFYSNTNPSGYITGVNLSSYANKSGDTFTGVTRVNLTGIGVSAIPAFFVGNTTSAVLNSQQASPTFTMSGNGWSTASGGVSRPVIGGINLVPVQGASAEPTARFDFNFGVGTGALSRGVSLHSSYGFNRPFLSVHNGSAGFGSENFGLLQFIVNTSEFAVLSLTDFQVGNAHRISWSNSATVGNVSSTRAALSSPSSNVIQMGINHATVPSGQTIKSHNVTSGTGANLTIAGGSGSVASGSVILQGGNRASFVADATTGDLNSIVTLLNALKATAISHGLMNAS